MRLETKAAKAWIRFGQLGGTDKSVPFPETENAFSRHLFLLLLLVQIDPNSALFCLKILLKLPQISLRIGLGCLGIYESAQPSL